jgi:ketosteroid isomerase-like protein
MTTRPITAPGYGRAQFASLHEDPWRAFRWVRDRDLFVDPDDDPPAHLAAEAEARDLLTRLCYAVDASDLETAASLFAADATLNGSQDIGGELAAWVGSQSFSRHRYVNTVTRLLPAAGELWQTCYLHQARVHDGEVDSRFSRCLARYEQDGSAWRIADLSIHVDLAQRYGTEAEMEAAGPQARDRTAPDRASRAQTTHRNPAFDGGRATWSELRDDVWEAHHWFGEQKEAPLANEDERLQRLVDEMLIRELLANYAYAHDSRDLLWTGSNFTDDAILINDTLRFDGNAEVIEAFRGFNRRMTVSFHRFANPRLKFVSPEEAWFVAYYHVPTIGPENRNQYSFGRYFSRLTKRSGRWQIVDWRIANDPTILPMELAK